MATSGTFNTSAYTSSESTKHYLIFSWEQSSQNITNNTTTINWTISGYASAGWVKAQNITLKIDGAVVFEHLIGTNGQIDLTNGRVVATGSHTIKHNTDGSKSFTVYLEGGLYIWAPNCSGTKSFTLNTIPRASSISATSVNIGTQTTITIAKALSSYTSTITYKFGSLTGTIATKSANTSIKWTVPTTFYAQIPNEKRGTCTLTCETFNGSTSLGTKTTTFTAIAEQSLCRPVLAPAVVDTNTTTVALTGDSAKLVKYYSDVQTTVNATARNSATIKSLSTRHSTTTKTTNVSTFADVTTNTFIFSATDSRGYTTTETVTPTIIDYLHLTCNFEADMPTTDGHMNFRVNGNFYNGSFGAKSNSLTVQYRYREEGGNWSGWSTLTVTKSGNTFSVNSSISGLNYRKTYEFEGQAKDSLETVTSASVKISTIPVFDWGKNDFNFNVPIAIQGNPLTDYVVEYGTDAMGSNGTWYWAKWASGKAECYGMRNYGNMAISTLFGDEYRSEIFTQSLPDGLFKQAPEYSDIAYIGSPEGHYGRLARTTMPTATSSGGFCVVRFENTIINQAYLSFHCLGRWK